MLFARVHTNPFWDRFGEVLKETDSRVHGNIADRFKHMAWVWHHNIYNDYHQTTYVTSLDKHFVTETVSFFKKCFTGAFFWTVEDLYHETAPVQLIKLFANKTNLQRKVEWPKARARPKVTLAGHNKWDLPMRITWRKQTQKKNPFQK